MFVVQSIVTQLTLAHCNCHEQKSCSYVDIAVIIIHVLIVQLHIIVIH